MYTTQYAVLVSLLSSLLASVLAQGHNVTVVDTDPSITYKGSGTGDASICKVDASGKLLGGQPGCYFFPSNCTSSVAMSQNLDHDAAASFTFKGSAIYINSGLDETSPIFTVALDGQSTDVDGVRPSLGFTCTSLFSRTDLDPTVEHTVTLSVKGPSPNRNMTEDPDGTSQVFSLINFIYTVPDSTSNSTSSTASNSTSKTNSVSGRTAPFSRSEVLVLGVGAMLGATAFGI